MALREKLEECLPHKNPLETPDYTEFEVQAIRALYRGDATTHQQRMVCEWIMRASGKDDVSMRPENPYLTAFAEGKRFIGSTFVWMLKVAESRTDPDKIAVRTIGEQK